MPENWVEDETKDDTLEQEEFIRCRQCRNIIASPDDRITVQGAHRHTFANPHGIVFEIGCFKAVKGCGHVGLPSDEFSWFSGYSWRVAICFMCLTHLGWVFTAYGKESFHGLILDRLITQ
ncbi:MAG: cereblon family protein [Desulfobacterales bacterium]